MSDERQLPFLIKLFDDDSPKVRDAVLGELRALRPLLEARLEAEPALCDSDRRRELLAALDAYERPGSARFAPGQLVRHRHYKYRGVVVAFDAQCKADDDWYNKNLTQPDRSQPWYHVLVHGSPHVTYAAECNLIEDDSGEEVVHPWLSEFFKASFDGVAYERNDQSWPGFHKP